MKLTLKNYFGPKNTALSSHKIKDYLLDPYYYFCKHVQHTITEDPTDTMIVGSMTECILQYGRKKLSQLYKVVPRRGKTAGRKIEVTQAMFEKALSMADRVMATTAYKELQNFDRQVILQMKNAAGPKTKTLCGLLDYLKVSTAEKMAIIVDFKTTRSVDAKKYFFQASDLGYFIQASCYVKLVKHNFPTIKEVEFYHLAIEKDSKEIYPVKTFKFDSQIIEQDILFLDKTIKEISNRKDWERQDASFLTAEPLGIPTTATPITEESWEQYGE